MSQAALKHRSAPEWPSLADDLAEFTFLREQGLDDEAEMCLQALRERFPNHPELARFEGSGSAGSPIEEAWDDAYIASIFDEPAPKPAAKPFRPRVVTKDLDAQSTLDIGIAFQEMGLTDDAAAAFGTVTSAPKLGARARAMLEQLEGQAKAPAANGPRVPKPPPLSRPIRVATVRAPSKPANARVVVAPANRVAAAPAREGAISKPPQKPSPPTNTANRPLAKVKLRRLEVPKPAPTSKPVASKPLSPPPAEGPPAVPAPVPATKTAPVPVPVPATETVRVPIPIVAPPRYEGGGLPPFEGFAAEDISDPAPVLPASPLPRRRRPRIVVGVAAVAVTVALGVALWPSPPDASPPDAEPTSPIAAVVPVDASPSAKSLPTPEDPPAPEAEAEVPAPDEEPDDRAPVVTEDDEEDVENSNEADAETPSKPRRRRRARKKQRTTEPDPSPAPAAEPVDPAPGPPKVKKPPSAAELLRRASAAHQQGDSKSAYRLAKRSHDATPSQKALEIMVVSACKNDMGAAARSALRKLPLAKRSKLRRTCRKHGTRIPL